VKFIAAGLAILRRRSGPVAADAATPYNSALPTAPDRTSMEAEHVNQIANSLADLKNRTVELRRYL
jgi:hypothetical protein